MRRTLAPLLVLVALVAGMSLPAEAHHKAKHKPKAVPQPVVVHGSYELELTPNPGYYVTDASQQWCSPLTSASVGRVVSSADYHSLRFHGPGTLSVSLLPELASFPVGPEWDLLLRSGRTTSRRATPKYGAYELSYTATSTPVELGLLACNKSGWPKATVSWTFTYR
jgi:hypothetical protein